MNCKCGGNTRNSIHEVKTLSKAKEYNSSLTKQSLPIVIDKDTCHSCGRCEITIIENIPKPLH